ncbi:MAG: hypothetical protein J6X36_01350 [Lachnospiraceae bacterium]|nr:hypothetical protein [Lachnospiraceae bacterium]
MSAFLAILLTILKVTGIVLLCIIGLLLFVLLIVLFVPIRYKADGFYKDSDYNVKAKASWLLHVVTVSFDLKASKEPVIKVFGIKLKGKKKKDEEEGETAEETTEDVTKEAKEETKEEAVEKIKEESTDEQFSEETAKDEEDKRSEKKDKRSKDKKEFKSESVYDKIKGYVDIIKSDEFKESFALVKKQLCRLLKAILPRKWEINASLGFEDPSLTGYVCAVSGAMYMWFRKHIHIVGDFDEEKIDAKAYFKGRIYIVVLVYVFLRVWFNKKIRHTIELFR